MRRIDKIFLKYEYLADIYANKVFDLHKIAYEKEDTKQDFREKLFKAILAFYRTIEEKGTKSVPLDIYLKTAMRNFTKDFITKINRNKNNFVSSGFDSIDYGINTREEITDLGNLFNLQGDLQVFVRGVDVVSNLKEREAKVAFVMYLKGYEFELISKATKVDAKNVVEKQISFLRKNKNKFDLTEINNFTCAVMEQEN